MCYLTILFCEAAFNSSPLALAGTVANWSLTGLRLRLVKTGGRLIKHVRWLLMAEGHLTRRLFGGMLRRIVTLLVPAG